MADFVIRETGSPFRPFPYQERHLQCLWADPRHRPDALATTGGEAVIVEHPGDWNLEAGPDFLNAVLLIGKEKRRVCGDLEIHVHANGWNQHGHTDDPRYENVRFHIVYFQGIEIPSLLQIPLQEKLSTDPRFSFENIDLTAYPYSIPAGNFPLKGMDPDRKTEWLEAAGEERLRLKAERLVLAMHGKEPEQILWEELMAALGYKNNKTPFRQLAVRVPLARLLSLVSTPNEAYSLLLGLSELLPSNPDPAWNAETRKFIRTLWDCWWKQTEEVKELALKKSDWMLAGIRPANHPVRRLMAAAHYAFRIPTLANDDSTLTDFPDNFWNTHISWKTKCEPTALVGQPRANAIITNILIPFRAATGAIELDLEKLPIEPSNSIIRQTAHALFGPDHTPKAYRSALARQGLIQIFHDYLITHRLDELKAKFGGTLSPMSQQADGGTTSSLSLPPPGNRCTEDDEDIIPPLPNRKHPAHHPPVEIQNKIPIVFLTVCSRKKRKILADQKFHEALVNAWTASNHWIVGRYVVMPDHIHLFCTPSAHGAVSIARWVEYWKRLVSQELPDLQPIWQRDCSDTQLRQHESYTEKWEYIRRNPVRAGLVASPETWPFQGTLNHLPW